MDELFEMIMLFAIIQGGALIMYPKKFTKKAKRDNPEDVARTKTAGIFEIVLAVVCILIYFMYASKNQY